MYIICFLRIRKKKKVRVWERHNPIRFHHSQRCAAVFGSAALDSCAVPTTGTTERSASMSAGSRVGATPGLAEAKAAESSP